MTRVIPDGVGSIVSAGMLMEKKDAQAIEMNVVLPYFLNPR
jgi:hypothetical protein